MSGVIRVKQGATVAIEPHLSLVVALPIEHSTLLALQETSKRLSELPDTPLPYDIALVESRENRVGSGLDTLLTEDTHTRVISYAATHDIRADQEAMGSGAALLAAAQQMTGQYIVVLDHCQQSQLPSPETLASMLLAAKDADIVVASRYLPGADLSSVTNSQGVRQDFETWLRRSTGKVAASIYFPRLRRCTDLGSNCYLLKSSLVKDLQVSAANSGGESPSLLQEILVRGQWQALTETPYRSSPPITQLTPADRDVTRRQLRALRRGPHAQGPVRYRYQHLPPGPYDPEPLDDELPDEPEAVGHHRRRLLWTVGLLALALRIILLPIGHWWDLTVDYNTFIDLAHNVSPYATMQYLSHIARASQWDFNYEYYAYPPVPLYIYYPLAHLYAWLHPTATYYIPVPGTFAIPNLSLDFFLLLKFPVWIADFLIAALLARMSGTIRGFRDYLLNPYVLLVSGAWTFDAIMVLGLVLAVYYLQRGKLTSSALALAFGTMVKFIPAVAVPTIVLYLIKKKRPVREIVLYLAVYSIGCLVLLGPFASGVLYAVNFHSNRVGGGMNWEMFWRLSTFFPPNTNLDPMSLAIGAFGTATLGIVLLLAYWYCFIARGMSLNRMILVTLLAFLIGSKLVNEQYALMVFPFAFLEARRVGGAWRWLARLLWIVPLLFAIVRVQIDRFLWLLYRNVWGPAAKAIAVTAKTGFSGQFVPWSNLGEEHIIILVLAVGFNALCLVAFFWPRRPSIRPCHHLQAVESLTSTLGSSGTLEEQSGEGANTPAPAIALQ